MTGFVMEWVKDIVRCEADDSYTTFHFINAQPLMVSRSLKECEEMLTPYDFSGTHHSHLINLKFIREYIRGEGGQVVMTDGSTVEVSRRKRRNFCHPWTECSFHHLIGNLRQMLFNSYQTRIHTGFACIIQLNLNSTSTNSGNCIGKFCIQ